MGRLTKLVLAIVVIVVGLFVIALVGFRRYRIPSAAMEPTFQCAQPGQGCEAKRMDRVLVSRFTYSFRDPHRGDVVAFKAPARAVQECLLRGTFLKRIVVLPGERWREQKGFVYVNSRRLDEPYVKPARRDTLSIPENMVPKGQYILLGDNRSQSCDSRRWGPVPRKNLIGPVVGVYWPLSRIGFR